ncbi:MAG TPA: hypothetical protein ENJ09_11680, partial [Planctomycetes bacterium]|nr:hypothetical protein [Planctomycetota bacterium]
MGAGRRPQGRVRRLRARHARHLVPRRRLPRARTPARAGGDLLPRGAGGRHLDRPGAFDRRDRAMKNQVWSWKGTRPLTGWRSILDPRIPWAQTDWALVVLAGVMVATSLVFVEGMAAADLLYGRDDIVFASHVRKLVVALPFLFLGYFVRPRWLRRNAWIVFGVCMALLLLVPLIGEERNNARRWIQLPLGFDLQPSEPAKIGLVLILARSLYRNRLESLRDWLLPGALALLPMVLVAAQPDLGTALTVVPVTLGMFWFAGASGRVLSALVLAGALFGGL